MKRRTSLNRDNPIPITTPKPEAGSPSKPEPRHALLNPVKDIAPIIIYFYISLEVVMRCFGGGKDALEEVN